VGLSCFHTGLFQPIQLFHQMEKLQSIMKLQGLEASAAAAVVEALAQVPFINAVGPERSADLRGPSFEYRLRWAGGEATLLCEVRRSGQPAAARDALAVLAAGTARRRDAVGMLVAPYISERVAELCAAAGIGTIDLSGNVRLAFGTVFIHRSGCENRFGEARERRSVFSSKAARVVRLLLERPSEAWQVQALSKATGVSIGQVSMVKRSLASMDWLAIGAGVRLSRPEETLRAWARTTTKFEVERVECYGGEPAAEIERRVGEATRAAGGRSAVCGLSAAWRWAPMVKPLRWTAYVDADLRTVMSGAGLKEVESGGNVVLVRPRDEGVFQEAVTESGMPRVGAVQAFVECASAGGRGEEAAEAVLEQVLRRRW
jgi:hypothetical protein